MQRENEGPAGRGDGVDEVFVEEEEGTRGLVVVVVVAEEVSRDGVNQLQGAREDVVGDVPDLTVSTHLKEAVEAAAEGGEPGFRGRGSSSRSGSSGSNSGSSSDGSSDGSSGGGSSSSDQGICWEGGVSWDSLEGRCYRWRRRMRRMRRRRRWRWRW